MATTTEPHTLTPPGTNRCLENVRRELFHAVAHLLRLGRSDATPGRPATAEALIPPSARSATGSSCGTTNCFGPGWPEARDPARWVNCGHAAQQDNRLGGGTRGRVPCPPTGDRAGQTERGWGQHCGCGPGSAAVRKCGRGDHFTARCPRSSAGLSLPPRRRGVLRLGSNCGTRSLNCCAPAARHGAAHTIGYPGMDWANGG